MMKFFATISAAAVGLTLMSANMSTTAEAQNRSSSGGGSNAGSSSAGSSAGRSGRGGGGARINPGRRETSVNRTFRPNSNYSAGRRPVYRGYSGGYSDGRYRRGRRIVTGLGIAGAVIGSQYYYSGRGYSCAELERRCDAGSDWACRRLEVIPEC